jgi:hypothetical protein
MATQLKFKAEGSAEHASLPSVDTYIHFIYPSIVNTSTCMLMSAFVFWALFDNFHLYTSFSLTFY